MRELRCKNPKCQCSRRGKLLARVGTKPPGRDLRGVIVEVVCPHNKKKKVKFEL